MSIVWSWLLEIPSSRVSYSHFIATVFDIVISGTVCGVWPQGISKSWFAVVEQTELGVIDNLRKHTAFDIEM